MDLALKVRDIREYEAEDLSGWLATAAANSGKSVSAICREAEITTQYWYNVINNRVKSIKKDTLEKLEAAIGKQYPGEWR